MSTTARKAGVKYAVYSMSGGGAGLQSVLYSSLSTAHRTSRWGAMWPGYTGDRQLLLTVFVLAFVGFGVKAAIWPLHAWLPLRRWPPRR